MNADCDQACLQRNSATDGRVKHSFERSNFALGPGDLLKQLGCCLRVADVFDSGLRAKRSQAAKDENALAWLDAG